jgi:hypothetical protein
VVYDCIVVRPLTDVAEDSDEYMESDVEDGPEDEDDYEEMMDEDDYEEMMNESEIVRS